MNHPSHLVPLTPREREQAVEQAAGNLVRSLVWAHATLSLDGVPGPLLRELYATTRCHVPLATLLGEYPCRWDVWLDDGDDTYQPNYGGCACGECPPDSEG